MFSKKAGKSGSLYEKFPPLTETPPWKVPPTKVLQFHLWYTCVLVHVEYRRTLVWTLGERQEKLTWGNRWNKKKGNFKPSYYILQRGISLDTFYLILFLFFKWETEFSKNDYASKKIKIWVMTLFTRKLLGEKNISLLKHLYCCFSCNKNEILNYGQGTCFVPCSVASWMEILRKVVFLFLYLFLQDRAMKAQIRKSLL